MTLKLPLFLVVAVRTVFVCLIVFLAAKVSYTIVYENVLYPGKKSGKGERADESGLVNKPKDGESVEYFEDFADGASDLVGSELNYRDGFVKISKGLNYLVNGIEAKNFVFSGDVRTVSDGTNLWNVSSLIFRYSKADEVESLYYMMLGRDNSFRLQKIVEGSKEASPIIYVEVDEQLNLDEEGDPSIEVWNNIKVKVVDDTMVFFVNGKRVSKFEDPFPLGPGGIGIRRNGCTSMFDNLSFTRLDREEDTNIEENGIAGDLSLADLDYFEDFEDGHSNISGLGLHYENGYLERDMVDSNSFLPIEAGKNFVFGVDFQTLGPGEELWDVPYLLFNYQDERNHYIVMIGQESIVRLVKREGKVFTRLGRGNVRQYLNYSENSEESGNIWNTLEVRNIGGAIECRVNGEIAFSVVDSNPLLSGKLGFGQRQCRARYDNIVYKNLARKSHKPST